MNTYAAVDLGASSGRVITGAVGPDRIELTEVRRFANQPVQITGTLYWDMLGLYREILEGLRAAGPLTSIGIDSWAVDYGLLDDHGHLIGNPVHYRDARTTGVMERVNAGFGADRLYGINGLQFLPFNTLYQLAADRRAADASAALLIPDLLSFWLTGQRGTERTNASTTGLYDARTGGWSAELFAHIGVAPGLFAPLRSPGDPAGVTLPETRLGAVAVTTVASHDTAAAIAAVPASTGRFGYISCGTWSLAGVELATPILTAASRWANFTNELGVDGTIRYLRNVMGLWLLQESLRSWGHPDLTALLAAAGQAPPLRSIVNPDDPSFLRPGDMPARINAYCERTGQLVPDSPAQTVRCILDSLALGHAAALRQAAELSGHAIDVVHLVGGGSRNTLLCQLTADAAGLPVIAGPAEATALGTILLQARAHGEVADLASLRALVARSQPLIRYEPAQTSTAWEAAADRIGLGCVTPAR